VQWRNSLVPRLLDNLIWVILVLTAVGFSLVAKQFFTVNNLINIFVHSSVLGILVIGQSFTLMTGNFDLSSEATLALTAVIGAWMMIEAPLGANWMLDPWLVVPIMLLIGGLIGAANGYLITRVNMNNFIVTMAMQIALRGAVYIWTQGQTLTGIPKSFAWLGGGQWGIIPVSVVVVILAFIVAHIVLAYRPSGREFYAVGGNPDAARAAGIDPKNVVMKAYIISGVMAAFAGWMLAGRLESVIPKLGEGMIFEVFAAAVIGGVSLMGGRGTMIGAFGGVLLLSVIDSGLNLMQVSPFWINTIRGLVILLAMFIDSQKERFRLVGAKPVAKELSKAA